MTSRPARVTVSAPEPSVDSVTVAGSLQSELGCPEDWQPGCAATHLAFDTGDGLWHATFELPAGSYDWKVAINDSWNLNYGAGGAAGGGNLTLTVPTGGGSYASPGTRSATSLRRMTLLTGTEKRRTVPVKEIRRRSHDIRPDRRRPGRPRGSRHRGQRPPRRPGRPRPRPA